VDEADRIDAWFTLIRRWHGKKYWASWHFPAEEGGIFSADLRSGFCRI